MNRDVIPEWLKLQRSAFEMLEPHREMIFSKIKSPLKMKFDFISDICTDAHLLPKCYPYNDDLLSLFSRTHRSTSCLLQEDMVNQTCLATFTSLRRVFELPFAPGFNLDYRDAVTLWPIRQPSDFFDLLILNNPKALIVFAFYCVLLKRTEDHWYLKGQSKKLLTDIRRRLQPKWQYWISWPLQEIDPVDTPASLDSTDEGSAAEDMTDPLT